MSTRTPGAPGRGLSLIRRGCTGHPCFHAPGLEGDREVWEGAVLQAADPVTVEEGEAGRDDTQEGLDHRPLGELGFPF